MNLDLSPTVLRALPVWYVATLLSVTFHEAAHAWIARRGGDDTAAEQVTLNPLPHMTRHPIGMIAVPLLSYLLQGGGWMIAFASVPISVAWATQHPRRAALVSAAGPLANFLLAALAAIAIHVLVATGDFESARWGLDDLLRQGGEQTPFTVFLSVLFSVNLLLGLFNLMPIPPLDGHGVVPLFLSDRATRRWHGLFEGGTGLVGLMVAWVVFGRIALPALVWTLGWALPA
ncbi:MAG: site-2 protease family protein [Myxococcota bacterium]